LCAQVILFRFFFFFFFLWWLFHLWFIYRSVVIFCTRTRNARKTALIASEASFLGSYKLFVKYFHEKQNDSLFCTFAWTVASANVKLFLSEEVCEILQIFPTEHWVFIKMLYWNNKYASKTVTYLLIKQYFLMLLLHFFSNALLCIYLSSARTQQLHLVKAKRTESYLTTCDSVFQTRMKFMNLWNSDN